MEAESKILIAITPAEPTLEEGRKIEALLLGGWHRVHLRHPDASREDMRRIIESIDQKYHRRLVLHGHFDLLNDFNLGGLHLNGRCPSAPSLYRGALSRSCHSIAEAIEAKEMEYVTLSPIFDSISKQGYKAAFSPSDLYRLSEATVPIIALGGISADNIAGIRKYNFSGYAMLGSIPWESTPEEIHKFATHTRSIC